MSTSGGSSRVQLPAAGGGFFEVDISRAPDAIRDLEFALQELQEIKADAMSLGRVERTARDSVSEDAAVMLEQAAFGRTGHSFVDSIDGGIREIQSLITDLRTAFAAYQRDDEAAGTSFRQPS